MRSDRQAAPAPGLGVNLTHGGCSVPRAPLADATVLADSACPVARHDRATARALAPQPARRFEVGFSRAAPVNVDHIQPGDVLRPQVFETVDNGLPGATGRAPGQIDPREVAGDGWVNLSHAGGLRASGRSIERLRAVLAGARGGAGRPGAMLLVRADASPIMAPSRAGGRALATADARGLCRRRGATTTQARSAICSAVRMRIAGIFGAEAVVRPGGDVICLGAARPARTTRALSALAQLSSLGG